MFSPNDKRALDIEADNGIEWRQNEHLYIARQNARPEAVRRSMATC